MDKKQSLMNTYGRFDLTLTHGEGTMVYDDSGKAYLDFVAGVAVNCLGHAHPAMAEVLAEQSKKLIHVSNLYWTEEQLQLADKLLSLSDHENVFFSNSGTEAVETALKIARKHGRTLGGEGKTTLLFAENSFHGRSLGALTVTGQPKYQEPFGPLLGGCRSFVFNDLASLEKAMGPDVCGVILEPVQGEGGIIEADPTFLHKARELCDEHKALLLFDEVQAGVGRTGTFFAYKQTPVIPDVVSLAKGLGGGFPIGATLASGAAAKALVPGDHGCTFGGSPLACAVSSAVLDTLLDGGVLAEVDDKGAYLKAGLEKLAQTHDAVIDVRGRGLMLGVVLAIEPKALVLAAMEKGLLLVGAGKDVVRLVPPLTVSYEELDRALQILEVCLASLENE